MDIETGKGERKIQWLDAAVIVSLVGFGVHNLREFGLAGLYEPQNGFIPMALLMVLALVLYHAVPSLHDAAAWALLIMGGLHLIGAVFTVLPLATLPFEPEQSAGHYVSHVVYFVAQVPLVALATVEAFGLG